MKFTKSLLAVAIAGIAAAPMMASATTTLSGAVQVQLKGDDSDDDGPRSGTKDGDAQFAAGDVLFGITAEQALNSGLTGYGSLRYDLDAFSNAGTAGSDNVYVGVKGGFGDLRFGETGNPGEFGQVNDIMTDAGDDINEGIGYTGTFGGATIGIAYSPERNQDILGVGAKFAWQGLALGIGMENNNTDTLAAPAVLAIDDSVDPAVPTVTPAVDRAAGEDTTDITASAGFSFAGASVTLGYVVLGDAVTNANGTTDDETAFVANVGYTIAGVSLGLTYDQQTESEDNAIRLDASYDLGGGMDISTRVTAKTDGENAVVAGPVTEDLTEWRFQLSKSF